jgi:hypothetical protein
MQREGAVPDIKKDDLYTTYLEFVRASLIAPEAKRRECLQPSGVRWEV